MMRNGMTVAFALVAAALSQTAGAITATKEYVDRKDAEIRTNTYTRAETDARIGELAPRTSLAPATNYTDSATNRLVQLLTDPDGDMEVRFAKLADIAISSGIADESHSLSTGSPDFEARSAETVFSQIDARTTTNDVLNIVTNVDIETQWVFTIIAGGEYTNPSDYHIVELDDGLGVLFGTEFITSIPGTAEFPFRFDDGLNQATVEVDRKNTTRNALGLARLSDLASRTTTNDVCNIVTNEVPTGPLGEWAIVSVPTGTEDQWSSLSVVESQSDPGTWDVTVIGPGSEPCVGSFQGDSDVMAAELRVYEAWDVQQGASYRIGIARTRQPRNALGLARLVDLPTNHVTRAEMEEAIDAIPEVDLSRFATKSEFAAVSNESALVTRLYTSSNVLLEVTNFNSAVNSPKLRILHLDESNTYHTVWAETNNLTRTLAAATGYTDVAVSNAERRAASAYAPRAWSGVTSGLGVEAPSNTTWISTPTTVIAGGLEYTKVVHSGGAIWVLSGNGMMQFDPTTNAYLRISADDGTEIFSIEKTDAVTVGAYAAGIQVYDGEYEGIRTINIPVNVVTDSHPTMYYRQSLNDAVGWRSETEINAEHGDMTVEWAGGSGEWECLVFIPASRVSGFFKFTYEKPGSTLIKNGAPMDVSGGIMCTDGIHKVRPVYSDGAVTWEVVQ